MNIFIETSKSAHNGTWAWTCTVDGQLLAIGSGEPTESEAKATALENVIGSLEF